MDDSGLGEGVRADELVVGRVEGHSQDTDFARDAFGAPGEVAGVDSQSTELAVAAADTDEMDALGTDSGVGGLTTLFESSVSIREGRRFQTKPYAYLFLR